jgi:hypothetical protein
MRRIILALTFLGAAAALADAQNPGQHVQVTVSLASISTNADTTGVSFTVSNLATSTEPLWLFFIDAPSGVLRITPSTGAIRWRSGTNFGGASRAGWTFLRGFVTAGSTTPQMRFDAVGLPGILAYWAGGYFPLQEGDDDLASDSTEISDPFVTEMVNGKAVGIEPWPANRSAQALLARLRSLTQTTCAASLAWITDGSLCAQLTASLDQAETYRAAGQKSHAGTTLSQYKSLLSSALAAGTANSLAYWLLKANADIVVSRL